MSKENFIGLSYLKNIDQNFLLHTISGKNFKKLFTENCDNSDLSLYIKTLIK